MSRADTDPEARSLFDGLRDEPDGSQPEHATTIDEKTRQEGSDLIARFKRGNQRPPAPTPDHLPFSDGRPFVSYQAVHSPAPSARPHITAPGVRVDPTLLVPEDDQTPTPGEPSPLPPIAVRRDAETHVLPRVWIRRFVVRGAAVLVLLVGAVAAFKVVRGSHHDDHQNAPTVFVTNANPNPPRLDIPPPPPEQEAPAASVSAATPSASSSAPRAVAKPLRPSATPSASTQSPQTRTSASPSPRGGDAIPEDPL